MKVAVLPRCPECLAMFIPCDKNGDLVEIHTPKFMRCPEPFNCELTDRVFRWPDDVWVDEIKQ